MSDDDGLVTWPVYGTYPYILYTSFHITNKKIKNEGCPFPEHIQIHTYIVYMNTISRYSVRASTLYLYHHNFCGELWRSASKLMFVVFVFVFFSLSLSLCNKWWTKNLRSMAFQFCTFIIIIINIVLSSLWSQSVWLLVLSLVGYGY